MRRLAASGLLPERAGQPVKAWVHISLAELRALDDGSVLQTQWITELQIRWSAHRAETADGSAGDGGAWLGGAACDATLTPAVTGAIDPAALDDLVPCACSWPATASTARRPRRPPRLPPARALSLVQAPAWSSFPPCPARRSGRPSSAKP
jgi:hypothetical protein